MINVGIMSEDEDCKLIVKRGSKKDLKVRKDEVAVKLCKDTVEKHSDQQQLPCLSKSRCLWIKLLKTVTMSRGTAIL